MIKSKLHNPIIAKNSHLENAVVEKVNIVNEKIFADLSNTTPIIPETGRVWYNSETGTFKFANIGLGGNGENFVDEFLSRTDLRPQSVLSKVDFKDDIKVINTDGSTQLAIDSTNKILKIENSSLIDIATDNVISAISNSVRLTDGINNKILADNINDSLHINYNEIKTTGQQISFATSSSIIINDGVTDKITIDNTNNSIVTDFETITTNSTISNLNTQNLNISSTDKIKITDGTNNKILANNSENTLEINYTETTITGNATVDGNMVVTGDLTVGGQTTKVDVAAEQLAIADNVIVLNNNLTETDDPRLASAIVDGEDVDYNAGIAINRGSEGVMDFVKWTESTDVTTNETLKEGVAKVSIWNYEAATPAYELHQIIDSYTLGREIDGQSGTKWIGYDGKIGINYANAIGDGATDDEATEYAFKVNAGKLDNTLDTIVQEIDTVKFDSMNSSRVGETPSAGTEFIITHGLGTVFVDVKIQREDNGNWFFDILPIQVIDANTIKITTTETTKIRYMITAIQGFDVNQATDLTIS